MTDLIVRPATLADLPAIVVLVTEYAQRGDLLPRSEQSIRDSIADWMVGEQDETVLACGSLLHYSETLAEVRSLVVSDAAQGSGIGRKIVTALTDLGRQRNVNTVFALTRAVGFFNKLDFATTEKDQFPEKIWHDCIHCPIRDNCDETAVAINIEYP